jgi:ADP-ribosylglycohydrolase
MLWQLAVGDAYGAGFEYAHRSLARDHNDATHYVRHPRHRIEPGCYTDDTQMAIAVAEALISGERWSPRLLADHFVAAFRRDPRVGYNGSFRAFLLRTPDGEAFLRDIRPHSAKSGAAMRAGPLGVLPTVGTVVEYCRVQAAVTHNTPEGINAACAAALMTHYFLYRLGPKSHLGHFLQGQVPGGWNTEWVGKVRGLGWMSVTAAVTAVKRNHSLRKLLIDCVGFGGDVDTVATIALAAASCSDEYEQDIPASLVAGLENGAYGREFLIDLDLRLGQAIGFPDGPGQAGQPGLPTGKPAAFRPSSTN